MNLRRLPLSAVSLALLAVVACGGDDTSTTGGGEGGSGQGAGPVSSSSSASVSSSASATATASASSGSAQGGGGTGGTAQGGGGQGGMAQGGGGQGGMAQGGGGQGGMAQGGGGQGGGMTGENCGNGVDDDGDTDIDCADADCAMAAACSNLVVNELDYDQPSTDTAEFVEIFNKGGTVDLTGLSIVLVNGNDGAVLDEIPLTGTLNAGQYLAAATPLVTVAAGAVVVALPNAQSNFQNGPDAVALYDSTTDLVLDAICYGGTSTGCFNAMINGSIFDLSTLIPTAATDSSAPSRSIIRFPNGQDTGDDSVDWVITTQLTPGSANLVLLTENCTNGADDDGDTFTDCLDSDCALDPACAEICDNGVDDNANGQTDCAEASCDAQPCDALGKVCAGQVCTCLGGTTEAICGDGVDNDCDGDSDCADADCVANPACIVAGVNAVDYPVLAHGGKLVITGNGFTGSTAVSIGGVAQTFTVDSDTQITVNNVPDATPIASQNLVVTTPSGGTPPFALTVIHLVINELDSDTPSTDVLEFVEISTGVPGVSLAGYTLVLYNGFDDLSYRVVGLSAVTDANGLLLVGNAAVVPLPAIIVPGDAVQNGPDGAAIHQALPAAFPNGTPVTLTGLIDALVYDTADADDPGLLMVLMLDSIQVDESAGAGSATQSVQRCAGGRRLGAMFVSGAPPTPGALNTLLCP